MNFQTFPINYYMKDRDRWRIFYAKSELEPIYVDSIADFIENKYRKESDLD